MALRGRSSDNLAQAEFWSYDGSTRYGVLGSTSNSSYFGSIANTPLFFQTNSTERMRITSAGLLGVGLSSPQKNVHIKGAASAYTTLRIETGSDAHGAEIEFADSTDADYGSITQFGSGAGEGGRMRFRAGGTETMNLKGGNVGIGTTSPSQKLEVGGNIAIHNSSNAPFIDFVESGATSDSKARITMDQVNTDNATLIFSTENAGTLTTALTINQTQNATFYKSTTIETLVADSNFAIYKGKVSAPFSGGWNTLAPGTVIGGLQQTNVRTDGGANNIAAAIDFVLQNNTYGTGETSISFKCGGVNGVDSTERMRITSGGVIQNATINSSTASAFKISNNAGSGNFTYGMTIEDDSSNTGFILFAQSDGTAVGSITRSGTSTVYATSSDYRLKEDLQDFNALEIASKIKMYDFKWNSNNTRDYGVIAHELQEVFPQAVVGEKDAEEMQGVDYSKLVPILLKSIQELEARVKELEKEI